MLENKKYNAILFDLDGVLVDMPHGHFVALNKALKLFGAEINEEEHFKFFNGLPTRKKVSELERQNRLPAGLCEFINEMKQKYTKEIIPTYCIPQYSKHILLRSLKSRGLKLACCSNSTKETLHLMLKSAGIFDFFDVVIGNDEISKPKPDPEIYLTAVKRLELEPQECIIIEDSPIGIESANKTGCLVYKVRNTEDVNLSLFETILQYEKI